MFKKFVSDDSKIEGCSILFLFAKALNGPNKADGFPNAVVAVGNPPLAVLLKEGGCSLLLLLTKEENPTLPKTCFLSLPLAIVRKLLELVDLLSLLAAPKGVGALVDIGGKEKGIGASEATGGKLPELVDLLSLLS